MVAGLGPRIREEHAHTRERLGRNHVLEHLDGVAAQHPHIREFVPLDELQQLRQTGAVDSTAIRFTCGSAFAIAAVAVPVPEPISTINGASRSNHAVVSIRSSPTSRPIFGHMRSQASCCGVVSEPRRERKLVTRGYRREPFDAPAESSESTASSAAEMSRVSRSSFEVSGVS